MNFYRRHVGDWLKATIGLSMIEEGAYVRLIDWMYANQRTTLPLDLRDVRSIARCNSRAEREAVDAACARFFERTEAGWLHHRVEREVERFEAEEPERNAKKQRHRMRQQQYRVSQRILFDACRQASLPTRVGMSLRELRELLTSSGTPLPDLPDPRQLNATVTQHVKSTKHAAGDAPSGDYQPAIQNPEIQHALRRAVSRDVLVTRADRARRVIGVHLTVTDPLSPKLMRLLADGVSDTELGYAAAEAKARGKSFAWMLATVEGRRRDAEATDARGTWPETQPGSSLERTQQVAAEVLAFAGETPTSSNGAASSVVTATTLPLTTHNPRTE